MLSRLPEMVQIMALSAMLSVALYQDARRRKIPNTVVLAGALTGIGLSLTPTGMGAMSSISGGMVGLLGFGLLYVFRFLGAGDVKLISAIGFFVGFPTILKVSLCIFLMGGVLAFAWGMWTSQLMPSLLNLRSLGSGWPRKSPAASHHAPEEMAQVPYAIAIAAGTWLQLASPWSPI